MKIAPVTPNTNQGNIPTLRTSSKKSGVLESCQDDAEEDVYE